LVAIRVHIFQRLKDKGEGGFSGRDQKTMFGTKKCAQFLPSFFQLNRAAHECP
jgi:hypothetical protein